MNKRNKWSGRKSFEMRGDRLRLVLALMTLERIYIDSVECVDSRGFAVFVDVVKNTLSNGVSSDTAGCRSVSSYYFEGDNDRGQRVRGQYDFITKEGWLQIKD